jgi:hypothetical protein
VEGLVSKGNENPPAAVLTAIAPQSPWLHCLNTETGAILTNSRYLFCRKQTGVDACLLWWVPKLIRSRSDQSAFCAIAGYFLPPLTTVSRCGAWRLISDPGAFKHVEKSIYTLLVVVMTGDHTLEACRKWGSETEGGDKIKQNW